MTAFSVIIPARYAATRLPGKVLLDIAGRPMLEHVYARARESGAAEVWVATDDARVAERCRGFGASVRMTSSAHRSGTDRLAEVVEALALPADRIVVNVQADEPLLPPRLIGQVAAALALHGDAGIATLCTALAGIDEVFDPNVVKVVRDRLGYALYFSRAPIPWHRQSFPGRPAALPDGVPYWRHVGLYAYRAGNLSRLAREAPSPAELAESLEQLRALHVGLRIHVAEAVEAPGPGVDTAEDLERVRRLAASARPAAEALSPSPD
jgi:3-deoxy-manno-octulosonate cytidylyltransferase (CMP-KDO synthetase)